MEGNLKGDYLRLMPGTVSRGQNELVGKFKMVVGDMVSIRGQVMEYMYIQTGVKRELVRSGVDCDWKSKLSRLLEEDRWPFILVDRLFFVSST